MKKFNNNHKQLIINIKKEQPTWKWYEITSYVNGKFQTNFGESTFRKWYRDYINQNIVSGTKKTLERVAKADLSIKVKRKIQSIQNYELNKKLNQYTKIEYWKDLILDSIKNASFNTPKLSPITLKPIKSVISYFISDFHYKGTKQEHEDFFKIINKINKDVQENHYKEITLCFMGDDIEGDLHAQSLLTCKKGYIQQGIGVSKLIVEGILSLLSNNKIIINIKYVCESNHGRIPKTKRFENVKDNLGYFVAFSLEGWFKKNPRIKIDYDGNVLWNIFDYNILLTHGDRIKTSKLIDDFWLKYEKANNINANYLIAGHFHHFERVEKYPKRQYILLPTCKQIRYQYEEVANFNTTPSFCKIVWNKNGLDFVKQIYLKG